MHPEICSIGPFTVYSYGFMLAIAFLVSVRLAQQQSVRAMIDREVIFNTCFIGVFAGIIGARVLYVIEHFAMYSRNPLEMLMLQHGGLSFFGGLLAGSMCAVGYLIAKKQNVWRMLDHMAPYLALGHAIGRVGCLLNGCCYGKLSAWGMYFPGQDAVLIPTQLYSSLLLLAMYVALRWLQERPHPLGAVFFVYLLLYSVKRFVLEYFRGDNYPVAAGLTFFQLFSIATFIIGCVGFIMMSAQRKQ